MPGDDHNGKSKGIASLTIVQIECLLEAFDLGEFALKFEAVSEIAKRGKYGRFEEYA
jgi:hypothetical protein